MTPIACSAAPASRYNTSLAAGGRCPTPFHCVLAASHNAASLIPTFHKRAPFRQELPPIAMRLFVLSDGCKHMTPGSWTGQASHRRLIASLLPSRRRLTKGDATARARRGHAKRAYTADRRKRGSEAAVQAQRPGAFMSLEDSGRPPQERGRAMPIRSALVVAKQANVIVRVQANVIVRVRKSRRRVQECA